MVWFLDSGTLGKDSAVTSIANVNMWGRSIPMTVMNRLNWRGDLVHMNDGYFTLSGIVTSAVANMTINSKIITDFDEIMLADQKSISHGSIARF